ncbi:class I SAM-dependent methyltransferase [Alkalicoccus luteus]|uniref:class I SAM-dependent methyltransferase n=1 Tax=Alkalicoccus luteus TaxID=1237094 RepID=UPI0040338F19
MYMHFGKEASAYGKYRNDLPSDLFSSLKQRGVSFHDAVTVDIGAGTGVLSRALSREGAVVTGVEPSPELLNDAEKMQRQAGTSLFYASGSAEELPAADDYADMITVMRAWHWFDREKALQEISRVLQPNGHLLVMDAGFQTGTDIVDKTITFLIERLPEGSVSPAGAKAASKQRILGFPVEWFEEWQSHHLSLKELYSLDYTVSFTNTEWCGRISSISWIVSQEEEVRRKVMEELAEMLVSEYPGAVHSIPHTCSIAVLRKQAKT